MIIRFLVPCLLLIVVSVSALVPVASVQAQSADTRPNVSSFGIASGSAGVCAIGARSGKVYLSHQGSKPLAPASILKVAVSAATLTELGAQYKARTDIYMRGKLSASGSIETMAIRAGVDPSFTIERLYLLARAIRSLGVTQIDKLLLDDTALVDPRDRVSSRAYSGAITAFNLNWNTVTARACALPAGISDAVQLSLDPFEAGFRRSGAVRIAKDDSISAVVGESGTVAFSGFAARGDCTEDYGAVPDARDYVAKVMSGVLEQVGVKIRKGGVVYGAVPLDAKLVGSFDSEPLENMLRSMNYFSNNMMAELLAASLGRQEDGRFSRTAGVARVERFVREVGGVSADEVALEDGSGLSAKNRLSANALCGVMHSLYNNAQTRDVLFTSLPQHGVSGTMKRRLTDIPGRSKTGSLSTVSSLAGVVYNPYEPILFTIIQNSVGDLARAKDAEDRVVRALAGMRID